MSHSSEQSRFFENPNPSALPHANTWFHQVPTCVPNHEVYPLPGDLDILSRRRQRDENGLFQQCFHDDYHVPEHAQSHAVTEFGCNTSPYLSGSDLSRARAAFGFHRDTDRNILHSHSGQNPSVWEVISAQAARPTEEGPIQYGQDYRLRRGHYPYDKKQLSSYRPTEYTELELSRKYNPRGEINPNHESDAIDATNIIGEYPLLNQGSSAQARIIKNMIIKGVIPPSDLKRLEAAAVRKLDEIKIRKLKHVSYFIYCFFIQSSNDRSLIV